MTNEEFIVKDPHGRMERLRAMSAEIIRFCYTQDYGAVELTATISFLAEMLLDDLHKKGIHVQIDQNVPLISKSETIN